MKTLLSVLVLATAGVVAVAIWGVVTDREGRRRDQPPWAQSERRHRDPVASTTAPNGAPDCNARPAKKLDPDFGPGGALDTGGPYKAESTEIDAIIYRGCPEKPSTP